jgi:hypothetical protein
MALSDDVLHTLRTWHRLRAGELVSRLGISRASLMRAVRELGPQVVARGRTRRIAYSARRAVRGSLSPLPLYAIGENGSVEEVAAIYPTHPEGCAAEFLRPLEWPLDDEMKDGWFAGLPYFLEDMRPQGFLGRHFARANATLLQVSEDPRNWPEDDALYALSVLGSDQPGNYILGEAALRKWLTDSRAEEDVPRNEIADAYQALATAAMTDGAGGSSAGGEFPKFTTSRILNGKAVHVLVKFSGSDDAPGTLRWSDLLVCEHLAAAVLRERLDVPAAQSTIHQFGGRTFLEVERFDRHGRIGRSPVCSWSSINAGLFGIAGKSWIAGADALADRGYIEKPTIREVKRLWHFGQLIANSDMHDGNLSFLPGLRLAPAYDMLPMMYAPERGVELPERKFQPALPLPSEREDWIEALTAARAFWEQAAADTRITESFRKICAENADQLRAIRC